MEWATILQIIGAVVALGLLSFTARQQFLMRRFNKSIAYQNVINASYELERVFMEHPKLYLHMRSEEPEVKDEEEREKVWWIAIMTLDFMDNLLFHKGKGLIEKETWFYWEEYFKDELRKNRYLCRVLREKSIYYTEELHKLAKNASCEDS